MIIIIILVFVHHLMSCVMPKRSRYLSELHILVLTAVADVIWARGVELLDEKTVAEILSGGSSRKGAKAGSSSTSLGPFPPGLVEKLLEMDP